MKNQKGITYLTLVGIVVVITIIVATCVYFIRLQYDKESFETLKTDMLLIQGKAKLLQEEATMKKDTTLLKGIKVSEKREDSIITEFLKKGVITEEEQEKFYVLSSEDIQAMELGNIKRKEGSYYLVNYETSEIIETKGYQQGEGQVIYRLSDMQKIEGKN